MKNANSSTQLGGPRRVKAAKSAPAKGAAGAGSDGRRDAAKQEANQREMGVGPDHKTGTMRARKRGTFP